MTSQDLGKYLLEFNFTKTIHSLYMKFTLVSSDQIVKIDVYDKEAYIYFDDVTDSIYLRLLTHLNPIRDEDGEIVDWVKSHGFSHTCSKVDMYKREIEVKSIADIENFFNLIGIKRFKAVIRKRKLNLV